MKTKVLKSKILLSTLLLIVISGLIISSCQKEDIVQENKPIDYEQLGVEHNKGLEFIFDYLKQNKVLENKKSNDIDNVFDLTKQATILFTKTSDVAEHIILKEDSKVFSSFNQNRLKSSVYEDPIKIIETEVELTPLQISFLNQLGSAISNIDKGLAPTIEKINSIEDEIISTCSEEEKILLLTAISIGKHSMEYWVTNIDRWIEELGGIDNSDAVAMNLKSTNSKLSWLSDTLGDMGKSDVVGGVIGACVGGPAGAVGGACYASAGRGIVALYDHWTE